jgi:hypothetical protein
MVNNIQLFVNETIKDSSGSMSAGKVVDELEIDSSFSMLFEYSVADIADISKKNSARSKTITLPGTKNNNRVFGNLYDINVNFSKSTYSVDKYNDIVVRNPNKKLFIQLLVNSETVITGFLQIINVDILDDQIIYECVIYNNAVDLMTSIGEQTLREFEKNSDSKTILNSFDHILNQENIEASWYNTWKEGYVYPMYGTHNKSSEYDANWFWPCPFYKTVLDAIITDAGYGWTGSFKSNPQFDKEIIAYVKDGNTPLVPQSELNKRLFRASSTTKTSSYGRYNVLFQANVPITNNPIKYEADNKTTGGNFDNGSQFVPATTNWNTSGPNIYQWDVKKNGEYRLEYKLKYDFRLKNTTPYTAVIGGGGTKYWMNLVHKIQYSVDGGANWINWSSISYPIKFDTNVLNVNESYTVPVQLTEQTEKLYLGLGNKVRVVIQPQNSNQYYIPFQSSDIPGGMARGMNIYIDWKDDNNFIRNVAESAPITQGDVVSLESYLPEKIKKKDLIADLIKRYNLYITVDPNNDRLLIFTERPNFYAVESPTLDWTEKKDYSKVDNIKILSEIQNKSILFTYKEDRDIYNQDYIKETGKVYGSLEYVFDNDFSKGTKKIESPFSSTPLVKTVFGAVVSAIDPQQPSVQPRILYWGGLKTLLYTWKMKYQNLTGTGDYYDVLYSSYPYAGHFDDPFRPRVDINFSKCKKMFYDDYDSYPDDNMYNTYWSDHIDQIKDGKLVTSYLYLNENDISYIKDNFNTKIFIKDSYYYVNKIIDYNPLKNDVTKVELLKIRTGLKWENTGMKTDKGDPIGASCPSDMIAKKIANKWYYVSASDLLVTETCCLQSNGIWDSVTNLCSVRVKDTGPTVGTILNPAPQIFGSGNVGSSGVVFGNNNNVGGVTLRSEKIGAIEYFVPETNVQLIIGNNNIVEGNEVLTLGSNNIMLTDQSAVIAGNNNVVGNSSVLIGVSDKTISPASDSYIYLGKEITIGIETGILYKDGVEMELSPPPAARPGSEMTYSGSIPGASFSGTPRVYEITYSIPLDYLDYSISVIGRDSRQWSIDSFTTTKLEINSNSNTALTGPVYFTLIKNNPL